MARAIASYSVMAWVTGTWFAVTRWRWSCAKAATVSAVNGCGRTAQAETDKASTDEMMIRVTRRPLNPKNSTGRDTRERLPRGASR